MNQQIINPIDEYQNYIQQFSDLHFTMNQLDEDVYFQNIVKTIIYNNKLFQEVLNKCNEFKYAYNEHFDNNRKLNGNKTFVHAPSPMASFLTCLIMGRFH